jgi:GNAT superfamily N-acetyltransferase
MKAEDAAFAAGLSTVEEWGFYDSDFERLLSIDPAGCFIAWRKNKRAGMVCTSTYGTHAFIGCLIVEKKSRGRGFGTKLMRHAIEYLDAKGVTTIELDGVISAVSMYRRLGFRDKYLSLRFLGTGKSGDERPRQQHVDFQEILAFDLQMTGIERGAVLAKLLQEYPDSVYIVQRGKCMGYSLVRKREGGHFLIGPLVAESNTVAEQLLQRSMLHARNTSIAIGVPEVSRAFVEILLRNGFEHIQPSLRMYRGEKLDYESHVYAILGAEKG